MAEVWSGDIVLPDGGAVRNVGLSSSHVAAPSSLRATSLRFLATVETARIPLYLAAGPSLDVWTWSKATEAWFESMLLSKPATSSHSAVSNEWWTLARCQSPLGVLVQVQNEGPVSTPPVVTELLIYGTIANPSSPSSIDLPTPPSSSPQHLNEAGEQLPELRIHALPLSSHLLHDGTLEIHVDEDARFLADAHQVQPIPQSPKRRRDIFEEATIASKKAKSRGGHGIAAAAARGNDSQQLYVHRKSLSIDTKPCPVADSQPLSATGARPRANSRQLSRSPSVTSDNRPLSRKGLPDAHGRRSNLSQVATIPVQSEEPTTESRNKDALSKVVMAAMRMHGMQQRKKNRSRRASIAPGVSDGMPLSGEMAVEDASKDEEYKVIYHQTYKGAALALRKHMSEKPLHAQPDRMRDLVEKFLTLFLTDPFAEPLPTDTVVDPVATPGSKSRLGVPGSMHSHASPFDLPSIRRPGMNRAITDSHVYTGSPVSRKRTDVLEPAPT
ncbi:hypothetical protein ACN47E_004851 [Coniothyrium glycines]